MPATVKSRTNMASISKVTRNSNEAPSHLTVNEWFTYASSTISAVGKWKMLSSSRHQCERFVVGLRDFPSMDDTPSPIPQNKGRSRQFEKNAESIFILPSLELRFQTRQLDGNSSFRSLLSSSYPIVLCLGQVYCSFETEFYEHIMFSFNAEHFYFLHDLISSYIKEKERGRSPSRSRFALERISLLQL